MLSKIKEIVQQNQEEIILFLCVMLVALLSFAVGYIAAKNQTNEPLIIEDALSK